MKPSDSVASDDSADDSDIYDHKINKLNNKLYNQSDSDDDSAEELKNILTRRKGTSTTCTQQTTRENSQEDLPPGVEKVEINQDLIEAIVDSSDSDCSILETSTYEKVIPAVPDDLELAEVHDLSAVSEYNTSCQDGVSFQDYVYTLKMYYNFKIYKFDMTYNTSLSVALKDLTDKLSKQANSIILQHKGEPVPSEATPASLKLCVTDILEACDYNCNNSSQAQKHPDQLELILQDGRSKKATTYNFFKDQPFSELKQLYAERASVDLHRVHLQFDGDLVEDEQTPNELELEDGDVIDVQIVDCTE